MQLVEKEERYRELVSRILTNKTQVGNSLYQIGLDLKEIKERELYLIEFKYFEEFLEKKIEISKRNAYRCIAIAEEFTLREFQKWGLSKLEIIKSKINGEERKEFLQSATGGRRSLPQQIDEFKAIKRLTKQAGTEPYYSKQEIEHILRLKRQFDILEQSFNNLKIGFNNWLNGAKKYENQTEISPLIEKAKKILEILSH